MSYEEDLAWERELVERCRRLASDLLDAAKELRWHTPDPVEAAYGHLEAVAIERGLERGTPAVPGERHRRKKLPSRAVWDRDGWECKHCGSHQDLTVDHIVPVVDGGGDELANLQTLCGSCNSRKGGR